MLGSIKAWILGLSTAGKAGLVAATVVTTGVFANAVPSNPTTIDPPVKPPTQAAPQPTTEHKVVTETKAVPFTSTTVEDATMAASKLATTTNGVNGVETFTYDVSYLNGVETGRKLSSDSVTTPATNEVMTKGTYVYDPPTPPPAQPTATCYPVSNAGNCYHAGQYCRHADYGVVGVAGNGRSIRCTDRWSYN
jgi:hypothetical protein